MSLSKGLPYFVSGKVVKGFGRGSKELNCPTANFEDNVVDELPEELEPGWAQVDNSTVHKMIMNIGWNPYYKNTKKSMEIHVLSKFSEDFYGDQLKICILKYLRSEKNFDSLDDLMKEIQNDIAEAKLYLEEPKYFKFRNHTFFENSGIVITIFSASNYYELGSNTGAYMTVSGPRLDPRFVQFSTATPHTKRLTFRQRVGLVESSALRELRTTLLTHKDTLSQEFQKLDADKSGFVTVSQWSQVMEAKTGLSLPWRMLSHKLVNTDPNTNKVEWKTTFQEALPAKRSDAGTVADTLYRNKSSLEAIFRIIDKDNSGYISLDEFSDACTLLGEHLEAPQEQAVDICRSMDMNKDGQVDLNEFLEAFRLVDMERRGPDLEDDLSPEEQGPSRRD